MEEDRQHIHSDYEQTGIATRRRYSHLAELVGAALQ
jgi:hypothetical protein